MKNIIYIFFSLIFISCVSSSNKINDKSKESPTKGKTYHCELVSSSKKLVFKLNDRIVNRSINIQHYTAPDSMQYLFYLNGQGNDICVFNIDSSKLIKTIRLESVGPNGVGGMVRGFEVVNFDSIYITSAFIRRLFIVNSDAKVIGAINYEDFKQDYLVADVVSRSFGNKRIKFKNGKIYMPFYPGYDEGNYKTVNPEDLRCLAVVDPVKRNIKPLNVGFPSDYWDSNFYPLFYSFFMYKDKFYLDYSCDDRIRVSCDTENWETYTVSSKYIDVKKIYRKQHGWGVNPNYFCFVADPYRNVFYRFVMHEQSQIQDRNIQELTRYPHKFSIMILDEEMNVLGETLFPIDTYDMHGYFINKDGLYLSRSNPYNPNYDVDKLEFELIKLEKHEK
ncbi:DUF4221 domain-containing protein [Puteibacter caeruleilacunae]|nr:DUF4221 domain-containing protein [Puteibacter caeruleilacunae]